VSNKLIFKSFAVVTQRWGERAFVKSQRHAKIQCS